MSDYLLLEKALTQGAVITIGHVNRIEYKIYYNSTKRLFVLDRAPDYAWLDGRKEILSNFDIAPVLEKFVSIMRSHSHHS